MSFRPPTAFPGFWYAVLLCLTFVMVQIVVMIPAGILDAAFGFHLGTHPAVTGVANMVACTVVLAMGLFIGRVPLPEVSALRLISSRVMVGVIVSSCGAVILLSEANNLLRAVLPPPEWLMRILRNLSASPEHIWASAFLLVIVAPVTEELMFRGLILRGFLRRFSPTVAIVLSSMLFGAVHLNPWQFVSATGLGLMFGWWYARTQSLVPSLIGHALANAAAVVSGFLLFKVRGFNEIDPFGSTELQPLWFDGLGVLFLTAGLWLFGRATLPIRRYVAPIPEAGSPPPVPSGVGLPPIIQQGETPLGGAPVASEGSAQNETGPAVSDLEMDNSITPPPKRQGMALASLVLGVLSVMCFGLFAGLPAIILGHTAHRRATKAPEQYAGAGLAMAGFVMGYISILTTVVLAGVLAGLTLPALAKAKEKAQSISCMNNMKQIGLAFRIWATDHQDRFPFNPGTNQPGPVIEETGEGAVQVFRTLLNELGSPRILVCPADSAKQPAASFEVLQPSNISYEIAVGPEVNPGAPGEILARCPIHGHELHCDGSVQQTRWR